MTSFKTSSLREIRATIEVAIREEIEIATKEKENSTLPIPAMREWVGIYDVSTVSTDATGDTS